MSGLHSFAGMKGCSWFHDGVLAVQDLEQATQSCLDNGQWKSTLDCQPPTLVLFNETELALQDIKNIDLWIKIPEIELFSVTKIDKEPDMRIIFRWLQNHGKTREERHLLRKLVFAKEATIEHAEEFGTAIMTQDWIGSHKRFFKLMRELSKIVQKVKA